MSTPPTRRHGKAAAVFAGLIALFGCGCLADWYIAIPEDAVAGYVGRNRCITCHQQEASDWAGSHHDKAMELATEESVLGDFDDAEFTRLGVTTRFFRKGAEYWVNTEGPDGELHDYRVDYTFGVEPLQQYMIELEGGRVQVLRVSWDTVRNEWFYVPPPDAVDERLAPDDPLHWTGLAQNWNTMCAECHSTNLQKNFSLASNTYDTTFSEIDVSCEACHGPGSLHVEQAEGRSLFWDRRLGYALNELKNVSNRKQLETCAPCHSRRSAIHGDWHAGNRFVDHYAPSLLEPGLYHADGQILDEVYVYGSFMQSKMYHENVKCTDCHNPHSLELKFQGNQLCAQCHQPGKYDGAGHHHHADAGEAAQQCVNCHMPERHYMVVDGRRDHSFRIPRPDLSVELGTPNACNDCHTKPEEDASWAAAAVRKWYGDKRPDDPHYAPALAAGWEGKPEAVEMLREVLRRDYPEIVHATAVQALGNLAEPEAQELIRESIEERSPLVRAMALRAVTERSLDEMALESAWRLRDSSRLVRFAAAARLMQHAPQLQGTEHEPILEEALKEYESGQEVILDRAGANMQRAELYRSLGRTEDAIQSMRDAIRMEPYLTGPRSELARMLEQRSGDPGEIHELRTEEAELLARDCEILPDNAEPRYRLGMLLYLLERGDEALTVLAEACKLAPDSYENWMALALLAEQQGEWQLGIDALGQMERLRPGDPAVRGIYQRMQQARQAIETASEAQPEN